MTHHAVEVAPGRTQYIFTSFPPDEPGAASHHPVIAYLAQHHTVSDIADQFGYSKSYAANLINKHRDQIEAVGTRGHQKLYRRKQ